MMKLLACLVAVLAVVQTTGRFSSRIDQIGLEPPAGQRSRVDEKLKYEYYEAKSAPPTPAACTRSLPKACRTLCATLLWASQQLHVGDDQHKPLLPLSARDAVGLVLAAAALFLAAGGGLGGGGLLVPIYLAVFGAWWGPKC